MEYKMIIYINVNIDTESNAFFIWYIQFDWIVWSTSNA